MARWNGRLRRSAARGADRGVSGGSSKGEGSSLPRSRLPEGSRFAVLASGSGTNLQALLDAYPEELAVVAGDRKGAFAFERARRVGGPVEHVGPAGFISREDYDREMAERVA